MRQLPQIVRQRLRATKPGTHPDADLLAAFTDGTLLKVERGNILDHLARCAECRDIVWLALPEIRSEMVRSATSATSWLRWPVLRWGAAAACVIVVGAAVSLRVHLPN